jgi:hypothetical protein
MLGKSSIANLETTAQKAQEELAASEAAFTSAVQAMESPPIELTDDQIGDLVGIKNLTEVRLVKARAGVRRAEHALTEARTAAAAKERADALARVMSLGKSAQKVAREELVASTKGLRRAIRLMAEAEMAREELNAKLPTEERLESFEVAVLARPALPEKVISRERRLCWVNSAGSAFSPEDEARIIENRGTGTATLPPWRSVTLPMRGSHSDETLTLTRRRYFERVVKLPGAPPWMDKNLAEAVSLPGLDGGPSGWNPTDTRSAIGALAELEAAASAKTPERAPIETVQAVSPVFQNSEELAAWEARREPDQEAA